MQNEYKEKVRNEWSTIKEDLAHKWKELSDTQLGQIYHDPDNLADFLQRNYGINNTRAREKADEFWHNYPFTEEEARAR